MLTGTIMRLLLLFALLRSSTATREDERKMRTALAASLAGIHGAIMNLSTMQSIRADIGDLFLVFGEYRGIRCLRRLGFATLEFYMALAGYLTLGFAAYYVLFSSNAIIPLKLYRAKNANRLILFRIGPF